MKKTIALTCILKNERHNLERFCKSFAKKFDEYHFTDTGSTDGSVTWLETMAWEHLGVPQSKIFIHHFDWINDFAAARNHAIQFIKSDYWMWADLDDVMKNPQNFDSWVSEAMPLQEMFYVPYNYAVDKDRNPIVSFVRERVFKTSKGFRFRDFIHEGVDPREVGGATAAICNSWSIDHLRTEEEANGDRGRNLKLLEERKDSLSSRLRFYYGKELFDAQKFQAAADELKDVVKKDDLEIGDRILAMQYLTHSLNIMQNFADAIKYGILGVQLDPNRAEFYCLVADSYMRMGETHKAIPLFSAAMSCHNASAGGVRHEFSFGDWYSTLPRISLGQIYFQSGAFEKCLEVLGPISSNDSAKKIIFEAEKAIKMTSLNSSATECEDIVITCPYPGAYPWDEGLYESKGFGGSETAAIEMAKWLKQKTGRSVKVFQQRQSPFVSKSGVEYLPAHHLHEYFQKWKPSLHIAWRHAAKLTNAKTVVWSHDLQTPGAENSQNYDFIFALSEFHREFMIGTQGVPREKILVTRNGIEPKLFDRKIEKKAAKVVWPNSPDRGLEYAIEVIDKVRESIPEVELHCFYGFDNMKKYGMAEKAAQLEAMISTRPWVKYHGNVNKETLIQHISEAEVWLYPASFLETFCITALESLCSKTWPVVREFGALKSTMKMAKEKGFGDIIDCEMTDPGAIDLFAAKVESAIKEQKWQRIDFDASLVSWSSVADEWIDVLKLK